jgi:cytochrome c556
VAREADRSGETLNHTESKSEAETSSTYALPESSIWSDADQLQARAENLQGEVSSGALSSPLSSGTTATAVVEALEAIGQEAGSAR